MSKEKESQLRMELLEAHRRILELEELIRKYEHDLNNFTNALTALYEEALPK